MFVNKMVLHLRKIDSDVIFDPKLDKNSRSGWCSGWAFAGY